MPGVPPNALNNLKRVLKGMFKRGRSKNPEQEQQYAKPTAGTEPAQNEEETTAADTAAATTTTKTTTPSPDMNKQLPLTTDREQDNGSQPSNPPVGVGARSSIVSEESRRVSPTSAAADPHSEPVSEIETERPPLPPPKNDQPVVEPQMTSAPPVVEPPQVEHKKAEGAEETKKENAPAITTTTNTVASAPPPVPSETSTAAGAQSETTTTAAIPNAASEDLKSTAPSAPQPVADQEDLAFSPKTNVDDETDADGKEVLPTKIRAAEHEMRATSGPLEDFPEGDLQ